MWQLSLLLYQGIRGMEEGLHIATTILRETQANYLPYKYGKGRSLTVQIWQAGAQGSCWLVSISVLHQPTFRPWGTPRDFHSGVERVPTQEVT